MTVLLLKEFVCWNNARPLSCPYLRSFGVWNDKKKDYVYKWIAKGKDPCPSCRDKEHAECHNRGQRFDMPEKLIIEKE